MSRYCWSAEDLLDHAAFLEQELSEFDPAAAADVAERFAKRVEAKESVLADWVRRAVTRERWLKAIDQIRSYVALGDLNRATSAAQSFEAERNHVARLLVAQEQRAGSMSVAGGDRGRTARRDRNEHRNTQIRAHFAKRGVTASEAARFGLSVRQVRRILIGK